MRNRRVQSDAMRYAFADCVLDTERCELTRAQEVVGLRPKVLQVLTYLIEHRDRVVPKRELFDQLWSGRIVGDATLNSCLKEARRAIGDSGAEQRLIKTLHGHGYHFITPVHEDGTAPDEAPGPPPEADIVLSDREHKQVSVLTCSIANIAELAANAEVMDQAVRRFLASANDTVQRYGGTLTERGGDGLTALFGAPQALEDHARRATLAATELMRLIEDPKPADEQPRLDLQCGLHTGSAVVGSGADADQLTTAVGATTQTARRLRDESEGSLLASEAFYQFVQRDVDADPQPLPDGTTAYRIHRLTRLRAGVPQTRPGATLFVGRDDEMSIIRKRLQLAQEGSGQTVCISGEPGIGKSRLVRELRATLDTQAYLQANCLAYRATSPYFPLQQLLRGVCRIADDDGDEVIGAKLAKRADAAGIGDEGAINQLLSLLDADRPADADFRIPRAGQQAVQQAASRLFLAAARQRPMVIAIEDLHWLDPSSEEWLTSFVTRIFGAPVLLLLTYRPGYRSAWLTHSSVLQLALPRLSDADSAILIGSLKTPLLQSEEIRRRIVSNAQGNPFFLEELTHNLSDLKKSATMKVPTTVQAVLAARIDQLRPTDKSLLQMAAVLGTPVPHRLLAAVFEQSDADMETAIHRLEVAELLFEQQPEGDRVYHFKHALTRDVTYQSLLSDARRSCHRTIAELYETRFAPQSAKHPEIVAHHFGEAGLAQRAMDYWIQAGTRASLRSANPDAVRHFERALEVSESLPQSAELKRTQLDIYLRLGPPLMSSQAFAAPSVEHAYSKAKALCESVGTKDQLFTVLWGLWLCNAHVGNIGSARELAGQVLELSEHATDSAQRLQAHHAAWTNELWHGDLNNCKDHAVAGSRLYDPKAHEAHRHLYGGHDPGVCAYGTAGLASWFLGYPDEARRFTRAGADLAARLSHPFSCLITHNDFMELEALCRDPAAALQYARAGIDLSTELNVPNYLAMGRIYAGWSLAMQGRTEEGLAMLTGGIEEYGRSGAERKQADHLLLLAEVYRKHERPAAALDAVERARELISRTGEVRWAPEILRVRGELELSRSSPDAARAAGLFDQACALAASQDCKAFELRAANSLASLLHRQGETEQAVAVLQPIYRWFSEDLETGDLRRAKRLLSELTV